mmetsp:Transcript_47782/g.123354  ORF Transcript_47782/g.123354 Transcript_47782/m.123354 type:complete len:238 (+) Transcript_47782:929-1642(+)
MVLAREALVLEAQIEGIVEQGLPVCAHIERDRQRLAWVESAADHVQLQLPNGDAHAASALVTEAQDPAAVGADDDVRHLEPVVEHPAEVAPVRDAEEHAGGPGEDLAELLAGLSHGGRVHDGEQLHQVVMQDAEKERPISTVEPHEVSVLVQRGGLSPHVEDLALRLSLQGLRPRRHQAADSELLPLHRCEGRALVQKLVVQQTLRVVRLQTEQSRHVGNRVTRTGARNCGWGCWQA